ncbi:MAG: single-stranded DNA-binding protein [Clostridia bacterium]|nr:single-stranded DNA-binding protein [Clostridia bacterium]
MASLNLNKVVLAGHLTATPELRQTSNGVSVTSFSIAINRRFSKSADGNQNAGNTNVDFINCVAWRNTADFITRYFKKGSAICVTGSLQYRSWTDPQSGAKRSTLEVLADEAHFVDSNGQGGGFVNQDSFEQSAPQFASAPEAAAQFEDMSNEDDLPF